MPGDSSTASRIAAKAGGLVVTIDDVRAVIGVQGEQLDWPYIESWCERHGTRALLEEIRRTVPKL